MAGIAQLLFGGGQQEAPDPPAPPPKAPRISDADASARTQRQDLKRRKGLQSTILTFGLGNGSNGTPSGNGTGTGAGGTSGGSGSNGRSTLLGGGST